jgi:hypothetical protein
MHSMADNSTGWGAADRGLQFTAAADTPARHAASWGPPSMPAGTACAPRRHCPPPLPARHWPADAVMDHSRRTEQNTVSLLKHRRGPAARCIRTAAHLEDRGVPGVEALPAVQQLARVVDVAVLLLPHRPRQVQVPGNSHRQRISNPAKNNTCSMHPYLAPCRPPLL